MSVVRSRALRAVGAGVAGVAVVGLGLIRLGGGPTVILVCGLLILALLAVLVLLRQVIFAPDDDPTTRLERILRAALGRDEPPGGT